MRTRIIARAVIVAAVLSTATAAVAAGVTLPSKANSHAVEATANVTTGSSNASHGQSDESHPASTPSPNDHAAFGQCVAGNAKTASDNAGNGGQTWNPTDNCHNANAHAANANTNANANAGTNGLATADANANSHASTGLSTAATHSGSHP